MAVKRTTANTPRTGSDRMDLGVIGKPPGSATTAVPPSTPTVADGVTSDAPSLPRFAGRTQAVETGGDGLPGSSRPLRWSTMNVLEAPPPRFAADKVAEIAAELFGVAGTAVNLGSERDQTFLIDDGAGGGGVIKISNLGEDPAVLDLETEAILHVARVDPGLPVAPPRPAGATRRGVESYRPTVQGPDGVHLVRLFDRMHGRLGGAELDDDAVRGFAT